MERYIADNQEVMTENDAIETIGDEAKATTVQKAISAQKAIEHGVVSGYKAIEHGVVGGYKAIEQGVTSRFSKITDKFVGTFLTREGETVEEAKARIEEEQKARQHSSIATPGSGLRGSGSAESTENRS